MIKNQIKPDSKIAIVFGSPSTEEASRNKYFQSNANVRLQQYLQAEGIITRGVSILFVCPSYVKGKNPVTGSELEVRKEILARALEKCDPNVIITIGELAFSAVTSLEKHEKYRGSLVHGDLIPAKVIPLVDPIKLFSQPEFHPLTQWDIGKAKRHSKTKDLLQVDFSHEVIRDMDRLREEFMDEEYTNNPDSRMGTDIEAIPGTGIMTCISFARVKEKAYVVPLFHMKGHEFNHALRTIDTILRNPVKKILQNGNFDIFFLGHYYRIMVNNFWWDTMLCNHCLPWYQKVDTLEGAIPIGDLEGREDVWVWSYDGKNPVPRKALQIKKTRLNAELIRVHIWRKKFGKPVMTYVDCTPDHRFLVGGCWIEAKDLKQGMSLTKVRVAYSKNKRDLIYFDDYTYESVSRYVWQCLNGDIPKGFIVHHKNEDPRDNRPSNLELLSDSEHKSLHSKNKTHLQEYVHEHGAWHNDNLGGSKADPEYIAFLYNSGLSQIDIARHLGASQGNVSRFMKKHNIKARSLDIAQQLRRQNEKNSKVMEIEYLDYKCDTYCMEIEDTHSLVTNNVVVHNSMFPQLPKGLDILASIYTNETYWKDQKGWKEED